MELATRSLEQFQGELLEAGAPRLPSSTLASLHAHYQELRRWAPKVDLVGPGAAAEIVSRHYAEALHALDWLPEGGYRMLDVGSGAGFPGFVLAAARPEAEVWLAEARSRRAAFLASAARRAGLGLRVVAARVAEPLDPEFPEQVDLITMRALRVDPPLARALGRLLPRGGRLLVWATGAADARLPGFEPGRSLSLPRSRDRAVHEYLRTGADG